MTGVASVGQCTPQWITATPSGQLNGVVTGFGTFGGALVAGGLFTQASGGSANYMAVWSGTAWQPLGTGVNGTVNAIREFDGRLIAGGVFSTAGGQPANRIASWDGSAWAPLGAGLSEMVIALAVHEGALIVAGEFPGHVARWDGQSWTVVGVGLPFGVSAVTVHEGALVAGGGEFLGFEWMEPRVLRWTGAKWEPMGLIASFPGIVSAVTVLHVQGGVLYAGAANSTASLVHSWTGSVWVPIGSMSWWSHVGAIVQYRGDLIAGGQPHSPGASGVRRWDGSNWSHLGTGTNGPVYAAVVHEGHLVLGGSFTTVGGQSSPYWARWGCPCYADCTNSAGLTVADFGCFQTQFVLGHAYADCNNDGAQTVADFGCFQTKFVQGCP